MTAPGHGHEHQAPGGGAWLVLDIIVTAAAVALVCIGVEWYLRQRRSPVPDLGRVSGFDLFVVDKFLNQQGGQGDLAPKSPDDGDQGPAPAPAA